MMQIGYKRRNPVFHIVGIGGIGMSAIAEVLHRNGHVVQGSDLVDNANTERLVKIGVVVFKGHNPHNVENADYVIVSTDVPKNNIEYQYAVANGIPVVSRAEILSEIIREKQCISVSGAHGKTTTTAMIASVFDAARAEPTVINGGVIMHRGTNAYVGSGKYIIVEADESDGTFVKMHSSVAVVTNVDSEHLNYYGTFENVVKAFKDYIANVPFYGFSVCCIDDPVVRSLVRDTRNVHIITYGIDSEDANVVAYNIKPLGTQYDGSRSYVGGARFDVRVSLPNDTHAVVIEGVELTIPGRHNVLNCLAAISVGLEMGFGVGAVLSGLKHFGGIKRRFNVVDKISGVNVVDDYAHHPAEIQATLSTAREVMGEHGKIIAVLQPHRYSRLSSLFHRFAPSLQEADVILVSPVYSAGEKCIDGIDHLSLVNELKKAYPNKTILDIVGVDDVAMLVPKYCTSGDMILFMGAGDVTHWAYKLPELLMVQTVA